jgi:DNA-binding CsgD family transcriptional regulator
LQDLIVTARPAHYNTRYKFDLSPRQRKVLDLIARGQTNAEIANLLGVSLDGAKYHVREILAKLDVGSREEAAAYWQSYSRPTAKLGRALSGIFGLGTLKAVAGGAAVIAAGGAVAAIVVGINVARESASGSEPVASVPPRPPPPPPALPMPPPRSRRPRPRAVRAAQSPPSSAPARSMSSSPSPSRSLSRASGPRPRAQAVTFRCATEPRPAKERTGYVTVRDASRPRQLPPTPSASGQRTAGR